MGRRLLGVLPAVAVLVAFSGLFVVPASAEALGSWSPTTNYPYDIRSQSCVVSSGYIYCVGGAVNAGGRLPIPSVNYASVSSSGVGIWTPTTSYPTGIANQPCVVSSGYIYCIGGRWVPNHPIDVTTKAVYYASVSPTGVGIWTPTTSYPTNIADQSCVVSSGYVYCVGGYRAGSTGANVYYAPLSPSGVGTWTPTTSYPTNTGGQSCVVSSGYIYCVGGYTGDVTTNAVYYASLSPSGVGAWTSTTNYPTAPSGRCVISSGFVYCIGSGTSGVNYASVSPSGVGIWTPTTSYPANIHPASCAASARHIYCVGGNDGGSTFPRFGNTNAVYYAPISQPSSCREADGNGNFHGNHGNGNFEFDRDDCKDGDRDQVSSTERGDGRDFQSTEITSSAFDARSNTLMIIGVGTSNGVRVTFVFIAVETGPTTPGWVSFAFSDGYTNAGPLVSGFVLLH